MDGSTVVTDILRTSGLTKSALSAASGVSRALLDDYLKGRVQPSTAQLDRLARAGGLRLDIRLVRGPQTLPESFIAVLEFGDIFPRKPKPAAVNLGPVWQAARDRTPGLAHD